MAVFLIQNVNVHPKHANAERIVSVVIIAHVEAIVVANSLKDCILEVSAISKMQPDGKKVCGNWHVYPEMAAAGLRTTSTDLAKFNLLPMEKATVH